MMFALLKRLFRQAKPCGYCRTNPPALGRRLCAGCDTATIPTASADADEWHAGDYWKRTAAKADCAKTVAIGTKDCEPTVLTETLGILSAPVAIPALGVLRMVRTIYY